MSKGTPITTLRIPVELEVEMDLAIRSANWHSRIEPYTKTAWILAAIREKISHNKRSKGRKKNVNT